MPGNFAHKESTAQVRWMAANGQLRFGMKGGPPSPSPPFLLRFVFLLSSSLFCSLPFPLPPSLPLSNRAHRPRTEKGDGEGAGWRGGGWYRKGFGIIRREVRFRRCDNCDNTDRRPIIPLGEGGLAVAGTRPVLLRARSPLCISKI